MLSYFGDKCKRFIIRSKLGKHFYIGVLNSGGGAQKIKVVRNISKTFKTKF
ncbi:hypothetical protein FC51_GL002070 [Lentilactobacillus parabuchneri DSM 5707 = NBRC 107865]|uniref:Uncharacterized protein n=1 Tax=Lentilactobacillus parabuchneri DSM 5707 = NBRC 107865 TaxID=1423784 RepID=A0A0R1YV64_9LACO|nr:hypothetical protein FC51_GL002070 [Lentilactobacillus parabuchneri DSM 5707 = NBRC 107865]